MALPEVRLFSGFASYSMGELDQVLLDAEGRMRSVPAAELAAFPLENLRYWAKRRGRYGLPTTELVAWLREQIAGRSAIEVGAGNGDLGRLVGIPMTDSHVQARPDMIELYRRIDETSIHPPGDVQKLSGLTAVKRKRPKVVVASWVTQLWKKGDTEDAIGSFVYGLDEQAMLKLIDTYIFIGSRRAHADKRILKLPHATYRFPWLYSRAFEREDNVIYVWGPHPAAGSLRGQV